jgi:hypothetical protein
MDATLVKGSHGRAPSSADEGPLVMTKRRELVPSSSVEATDVFHIILAHLGS